MHSMIGVKSLLVICGFLIVRKVLTKTDTWKISVMGIYHFKYEVYVAYSIFHGKKGEKRNFCISISFGLCAVLTIKGISVDQNSRCVLSISSK